MFTCAGCDASTPKQCTCKAAPSFEPVEKYDEDRDKYVEHMLPQGGMSLRDYFAAKAMQAIFEDGQTWTRVSSYGDCANRAYQMADAMLAERSK